MHRRIWLFVSLGFLLLQGSFPSSAENDRAAPPSQQMTHEEKVEKVGDAAEQTKGTVPLCPGSMSANHRHIKRIHKLPGNAGQPGDVFPDSTREIKGYELVWSDEFNSDGAPDERNWLYERGFVRNKELQWYQASNAFCKDGLLIIEGRHETIKNNRHDPQSNNWRLNRSVAHYSSACLKTMGLQEWPAYGYVEISARFDTTGGAWPALWILGTQSEWPSCGEIDILEYYRIDNQPVLLANAAWGSERRYSPVWDTSIVPLEEFMKKDKKWTSSFHTYSMYWDEQRIRLYIDNYLMNEIDLDQTTNADGSNPFREGNTYYLLINLAIGSNGGTPDTDHFPVRFEIDYVRVYQPL